MKQKIIFPICHTRESYNPLEFLMKDGPADARVAYLVSFVIRLTFHQAFLSTASHFLHFLLIIISIQGNHEIEVR